MFRASVVQRRSKWGQCNFRLDLFFPLFVLLFRGCCSLGCPSTLLDAAFGPFAVDKSVPRLLPGVPSLDPTMTLVRNIESFFRVNGGSRNRLCTGGTREASLKERCDTLTLVANFGLGESRNGAKVNSWWLAIRFLSFSAF